MLFNTIEYALFLPLILGLYYAVPHRFRWALLLAASYFFYMSWKVEYIILILASTGVDYLSGIMMEKQPERKARLPFLLLSLFTNLGLLFVFKYYNFAIGNLNAAFQKIGLAAELPIMRLLLPVGISFYTFQTLSYSIDVYFGRQKAEHHLGYFALYVAFFPQLVAGPIERYSRLAPQLKAKHRLSYDNLAKGLRLILYGLFIKMVIADNLSGLVDQVYAHPEQFARSDLLLGICFYSFQIYSDFFGYSLIAIGSALIMGITIIDNFNTPYLSRSIGEFWQRWHISLSTWFRDYLYFPLGGNRVAKARWMLNILIVFLVSGLWHGANWTFVIWGGLFGLLYLAEKGIEQGTGRLRKHRPYSPRHLLLAGKTFALVTLIWVFFRSQSFEQAIHIFGLLIHPPTEVVSALNIAPALWIFLGLFIASDFILYNKRFDEWTGDRPAWLRWLIYSILLFAILVFAGVENFPFIYFQF
ncbi:MAG: membrane-bound O-acyltransferase family protein [Bacteroidetes bacterium]|nr:MAG: membrane-bound O-acyltransferase family protein [Bacteroidota bacterium]